MKDIQPQIATSHLTKFQKEVLTEVLRIPKGEVRTYKEIAQNLNRPNAARAVGTALAKNPFLIDVPCHRVITSSGALGNYQKGTSIKKKLLSQEGYDQK